MNYLLASVSTEYLFACNIYCCEETIPCVIDGEAVPTGQKRLEVIPFHEGWFIWKCLQRHILSNNNASVKMTEYLKEFQARVLRVKII